MEYNSFYGGRRGASFIIIKQYPDIPTMTKDFRQGGLFTTVNYDEYVIINCVNKNHPDNGKIFRRGYDYNSGRTITAWQAYDKDTGEEIIGDDDSSKWPEQYKNARYELNTDYDAGGALYAGTIVGPTGKAPHLTLTTYADAAEKQAQTGFDERKTSGEYVIDEDLLPGKYIENGQEYFHDSIEWYCTSIRNPNGEDTDAYIGFKLPYLIIDYITHQVEPYNQSGVYADMTSALRIDDTTHPFYEKWNIAIPKGVKGDALKNFRIITPQAGDHIYSVGTTTQYPGFEEDVSGRRKIMVYDYYNYDVHRSPEKITYYLGDYNNISDFTIDEHGTITIAYTHEDTLVYHQLIKWITDVTMNKDIEGNDKPGRLIVKYNTLTNNKQDYDQYDLDWVQNITFDEDGSIHIDRTVSGIKDLNEFIYWIKSVSLNSLQGGADEGLFTVKFNHGQDFTTRLKWVNNLAINDRGQITLYYSGNGTSRTLSNHLVWPRQFAISEDGTIKIINNDSTVNLELQKFLKFIDNVSIDTGEVEGEGSQKVIVKYNNDEQAIGNPLNYLMRIDITKDHHLVMLYSDPAKRQSVIDAGRNYTHDGRNDWLDLGSVYSYSGIYVGKNYNIIETPEMSNVSTAITYLNQEYPNGLTGDYLQDKIVTAGDDNSSKTFYAFDYAKRSWFYLGSMQSAGVCVAKDDGSIESESKKDALPGGGVWLVVESGYTITYDLTNVFLTDTVSFLKQGYSYTTEVIPYNTTVQSVSVIMNNINITSSAWSASSNTITIPTIMGNVRISVVGD